MRHFVVGLACGVGSWLLLFVSGAALFLATTVGVSFGWFEASFDAFGYAYYLVALAFQIGPIGFLLGVLTSMFDLHRKES